MPGPDAGAPPARPARARPTTDGAAGRAGAAHRRLEPAAAPSRRPPERSLGSVAVTDTAATAVCPATTCRPSSRRTTSAASSPTSSTSGRPRRRRRLRRVCCARRPARRGRRRPRHARRPRPAWSRAFAEGVDRARASTSSTIGLGSTDLLYFASGALDLPGAMFTASHNPAQYNGIKLCRAGAAPVGQDTGLADDPRRWSSSGVPDRPTGRPRHRRAARPARRLRRATCAPRRPVAASGR